jgi:hypothetical protein
MIRRRCVDMLVPGFFDSKFYGVISLLAFFRLVRAKTEDGDFNPVI